MAIELVKLDLDRLEDESVERESYGECPHCERPDAVLCWICGVCLKYCHDDYFHEALMEDPFSE